MARTEVQEVSDIADKGNEAADLFLSAALRNRQNAAITAPTSGIGICLNCHAEVEGERRWCNAECRDEWQAEQKRRE